MVGRDMVKLGTLHLLLCSSLFLSGSQSQTTPLQSDDAKAAEVSRALVSLRSGEFNVYYAEVICQARATEAVPDLEKQFLRLTDPLEKAKSAQVLLCLGDKKDVYWEYLSGLARAALNGDMPDPALYDSNGKHIQGLSKEFAAWAKAHGLSPEAAGENAVYILPAYVVLLGMTSDPRAVPLLRRALSSKDPMIQIAAADGIAEMHDVSSVPAIIARCKTTHPEFAEMIAESLVYFDDQDAQAAVDRYVPKDRAKALRERRADGKDLFH